MRSGNRRPKGGGQRGGGDKCQQQLTEPPRQGKNSQMTPQRKTDKQG